MIRVVIDTNVVVSALLLAGSLPEAVINLAFPGDVRWIASEPILSEYALILRRPRLAIDPARAADAMRRIRACVSLIVPTISVNAASDPDDNMFLECAEAGGADYIVTGNIRHFPAIWRKTRTVTPREFIDVWTAALENVR